MKDGDIAKAESLLAAIREALERCNKSRKAAKSGKIITPTWQINEDFRKNIEAILKEG